MKRDIFPIANLRQILISLVERYHPFKIRYFKIIVGIMMTLLLGAVLILGWLSSRKVKEIVTEDFNQQQLVIARHVARQVENSIDSLKRELQLLSLSPSIQYFEAAWLSNRMEISFSSIKHQGTLEIRFTDNSMQRVFHVTSDHKCATERPLPEDLEHLVWARQEKNRGHIVLSTVTPVLSDDGSAKPILKMMIPVWQISVDQSHPLPLKKFAGVLVFVVDVNKLIEPLAKEIRSGKTGYSWVIDEQGTFLYHQESSFIGKNAFEARKGKKPTISFARINEIQKDKMLKAEEGKTWYISGWHRGMEGEIRKLIAYTPILLEEKPEKRFWSVAVVAPVSEVEGSIHSIQIQQLLLQGIIIFAILSVGLFVNFMILSWSNILEQEVTKKTSELKKSEQKYKSLVENAEDIIFTVDYSGKFLSINNFGAAFLSGDEENIIGHSISEFFTWPSSEILILMIQNVYDTKESKQITHMVIIGDRQFWFNTNFRRLWDEAGNIYAVLGISRDVTERKQMEEHSFYTEKLASMGTLAAGVAHEINNPLGIILGFTELLLEKFPPDSEEYDLLKTVEKQGLNAKRVVENLLNFARHKEHKEEAVDVDRNIEDVLSVMGNTLLLNKVQVVKQLEHDLPRVIADAGELQQVFFNVINNAIYAMSKMGGGTLTVTTASVNDSVQIKIRDTGEGIKQEHRKRIFDPLFTTKEVGKGTGLGLSVSYGIITKHNGTITFDTKTKDESVETGTTFVITLPGEKKAVK